MLSFTTSVESHKSLIYLFKFCLQHTMAQCWLPLQLPAAVFAQVEGLENLLQSHHLHKGNRYVTKRPSVCFLHEKLGWEEKKNWASLEIVNICRATNLRWQVHFHWDVGWPITHRQDVHGQFNVAWNVLALHVLQIRRGSFQCHFLGGGSGVTFRI